MLLAEASAACKPEPGVTLESCIAAAMLVVLPLGHWKQHFIVLVGQLQHLCSLSQGEDSMAPCLSRPLSLLNFTSDRLAQLNNRACLLPCLLCLQGAAGAAAAPRAGAAGGGGAVNRGGGGAAI